MAQNLELATHVSYLGLANLLGALIAIFYQFANLVSQVDHQIWFQLIQFVIELDVEIHQLLVVV